MTATKKGATENDTDEKKAANSVLVEPVAPIQLPSGKGIGSMADYLAMRERKKEQASNVVATGSGTKTDRVAEPETDLPNIENEEVEEGYGLFT